MRAPAITIAAVTAVSLAACSTPRRQGERTLTSDATTAAGDQRIGPARGEGEARYSRDILLAAGGSRPPPRPPPVPPRPPARSNPRDKQGEPVRPGHVPGRRLAGPPDAPYWETVFEIPWRGEVLQGPRPAPPRARGKATEPAQLPPQHQPGPPPRSAAEGIPPIKAGTSGGPTAGQRFSKGVREEAFAENPAKTCVYCGRDGTGTQVDHAAARSKGGNATSDNAQLACPHCNASKGAGTLPKTPPAGYEGPWPPPHWPPE